MKCYVHSENESIGICKACQKAVCLSCAIDTGRGIACSEECEKEVSVINTIIDKSKHVYNIGSSSKVLPTSVLMCFFFGVVFTAFAVLQLIGGRVDYFLFVMGGGFILLAIIAYLRNRKLNITI